MAKPPRILAILGLGIPLCLSCLAQPQTPGRQISGTWSGSITIKAPNGAVEHGNAWLYLNATGATLQGGLGDSAEKLTSIKNGTVSNDECAFDFSFREKVVRFKLRLSEGHLAGQGIAGVGNGTVTIDLDLRPSSNGQTLFGEISLEDPKLFAAFNARDLKSVEAMFSKDLEFYHDKDGLTNYGQNME